jgi:lipopolysaccharide/colanic/teichoic acid biosynthesis glycosyltransferase
MIADADDKREEVAHLNEMNGPVFKAKKDPRVTGVGRILRRFSFDEIPQLWNVLKGQMRLVGPRPRPVRAVDGFEDGPHRRRFSVRPGLTGLWQVSGRSDVAYEKRVRLDMQYIRNWNIWHDLYLLTQTIPAVIKGKGAY